MTNVYNFYADSGHGWLKVPMTELLRLGIGDLISGYSYYRKGYAYLEEDCDAAIFTKARADEDRPISVRYFSTDRRSKIRNYQNYGGNRVVSRTNLMTGKTYTERADTPVYMSPACESYWSM